MITYQENILLVDGVKEWSFGSNIARLQYYREGTAIHFEDGSQFVIMGGPDRESMYLVQTKFKRNDIPIAQR